MGFSSIQSHKPWSTNHGFDHRARSKSEIILQQYVNEAKEALGVNLSKLYPLTESLHFQKKNQIFANLLLNRAFSLCLAVSQNLKGENILPFFLESKGNIFFYQFRCYLLSLGNFVPRNEILLTFAFKFSLKFGSVELLRSPLKCSGKSTYTSGPCQMIRSVNSFYLFLFNFYLSNLYTSQRSDPGSLQGLEKIMLACPNALSRSRRI